MRSARNSSSENQIRVRRRQSDARWRANLSCCYETLKHIIPVTKRATRRKISKAIILKETAKHIDFLESMVVTLLQEKAEKKGIKYINSWCTKKVDQLQDSFIVTQKQQNTTASKKRTRDHKNAHDPTRYICSGLDKEVEGMAETRGVNRPCGRRTNANTKSLELTPVKSEEDAGQAIGFTPVKLPPSRCWAHTPIKNFETLDVTGIFDDYTGSMAQSLFIKEEDSPDNGTQQLLCTERMWLSDDEDASVARNQQTPKLRKSVKGVGKPGPRKGRRRLEEDSAASVFAYSVHQHEKVQAESRAKESVKCCRALNLDEWTAGKMVYDLPFCKQEDLFDQNPILSLSETDLHDEKSVKEFESDFCLLDQLPSSSQDATNSVPWRDDSPLLSQTSSAFTANLDDHSTSQASCLQFVLATGNFGSKESEGYVPPSPDTDIEFDVKPMLPDVSLYEGDVSSMTMDQPEYLGQYSPLFGRGVACLLSL